MRCYEGCNAPLLPVESLVVDTHQILQRNASSAPALRNLTLGVIIFQSSRKLDMRVVLAPVYRKLFSPTSARSSLLKSVFSDVEDPLVVEIDQAGSSCTTLSVKLDKFFSLINFNPVL